MSPYAPPSPDPAAAFRTTRAAHRDETAQDYVEAIAQIIRTQHTAMAAGGRAGGAGGAGAIEGARVRDLAALMGVSHVTVTRIIARLQSQGLVRTEPYRPITLTPRGRRLAERTRRRHETVLAFLHAIGVPAKQAALDAEGIEHHVSDATIAAMERLVKRERARR